MINIHLNDDKRSKANSVLSSIEKDGVHLSKSVFNPVLTNDKPPSTRHLFNRNPIKVHDLNSVRFSSVVTNSFSFSITGDIWKFSSKSSIRRYIPHEKPQKKAQKTKVCIVGVHLNNWLSFFLGLLVHIVAYALLAVWAFRCWLFCLLL